MTAMYRVGSVNVVNGQTTITGVGTKWLTDAIAVAIGDWFTLDMKTWYEVIAVDSDTSITLDRGFEGSTQNGVNYGIGRLTSASDIQQVAGQIASQFSQKQLFLNQLRTWLSSTEETEPLSDSHGDSYDVKTPAQMASEHETLISSIESDAGNIKAMRSVVYDAMCEANRLKYGASGFVEFGKHSIGADHTPVNTGITVIDKNIPTWAANSFWLYPYFTTPAGGSDEFPFPIINANGSIIELDLKTSGQSDNYGAIKLPPAPDGLDKADGTGRFTDLAAAIVAGGNDLSASRLSGQRITVVRKKTITVTDKVYPNGLMQFGAASADGITLINNPDQSECRFYDDNWAQDTTTVGKIFDWSNLSDANKDTVLRNPKHNLRYEDGVLKQDVVQIFSYQTATTYNTDIASVAVLAEGFNAVSNDSGLFTDGLTWDIVPICLVDVMNQGAYHPEYNDNGAGKLYSPSKQGSAHWFEDVFLSPSSVSDCFDPNNTYLGEWGSVANGNSGHFSGRLYDAVYADQITDLRLDVSRKFSIERANRLAKRLSINGTASANETEHVPFTRPFTQTRSTFSGTSPVQLDIGDTTNLAVGDKVWSESGGEYIEGYIHSVIDGQSITVNPKDQSDTYGRTLNSVVLIESLVTHKSKYRTDIIGTPSEVLATFPDGVHGAWIPVLPDGTSKEFKYTRKVVDYVSRVFTTDGGATWSIATNNPPNYSESGNSYSYSEPANLVLFSHYEYAPNFTEPADQARVDYSNWLVFATNSYHIYYDGASLTQSLIGKVPTVNTLPFHLDGINLEGVRIIHSIGNGKIYDQVQPTHNTIELGEVDSPAAKTFFYAHISDSGIVEHYVVFKEMVFDSSVDTPAELNQKDGNIAQEYWKDISYRVDTGSEQVLVIALRDSGVVTFTDFTEQGDYYVNSSGVKYFKKLKKLGFGDDNKFNIVDGEAFVTDLNGNTVKVGCHRIKGIPQIYIPPTQLEQ